MDIIINMTRILNIQPIMPLIKWLSLITYQCLKIYKYIYVYFYDRYVWNINNPFLVFFKKKLIINQYGVFYAQMANY